MTPGYVKQVCSLSRQEFETTCRRAASGMASSWARVLGEGGPLIKVCADDPEIAPHLTRDGFWEPWITMALGRMDLVGKTAWNIGANQGYYTAILSMMVGEKGRVVAFEPQQRLLSCICDTAAENEWNNIFAVRQAVMRQPGEVSFHVNLAAPGQSSALPVRHDKILSVRATSLDESCSADGPPDLIFCDVEGGEEAVFLGSKTIIEHRPIVFLEFSPVRYHTPRTLLHFFTELGYSVGRVYFDGENRPFDASSCIDRGTWTVLVFTPDRSREHFQSSSSPSDHEEGP